MGEAISPRTKAILEALLVTFLWSSSYIFTKFGLIDIQPLTLVGLRYLIASIVLVPIALSRGEHRKIKGDAWWKLAVLGFLGYTVAQGLQCVGLSYLPAVMVTLILNFTPLVVMILNVLFTGEYPNRDQIAGMVLVLTGAVLFFSDRLEGGTLTGVLITFVSGLGWAGYMVAGKLLFKEKRVSPLGNTAFAMGFGTALISASALLVEGLAPIPLTGWAIIIWLGVVNTAAAFFYVESRLGDTGLFRVKHPSEHYAHPDHNTIHDFPRRKTPRNQIRLHGAGIHRRLHCTD